MNELRKEIEHQLQKHGLFTKEIETDVKKITEPVSKEHISKSKNKEEKALSEKQVSVSVDFQNLPPKWQEYLRQREQNFENTFNELKERINSYLWIDEIFAHHQSRLKNAGIQKVRDWLEGLVKIDEAMSSHPIETIQALAQIYGVKDKISPLKDDKLNTEFVSRLSKLEQNYHDLILYLQDQQKQRIVDMLHMFGGQTDEDGKPLHPHFDEVEQIVFNLLNSGAVKDVSEAYKQALWLHPTLRTKLIDKTISIQTTEAQKAKKAGFTIKGKSKAPERELTLREEIEKNMAAILG